MQEVELKNRKGKQMREVKREKEVPEIQSQYSSWESTNQTQDNYQYQDSWCLLSSWHYIVYVNWIKECELEHERKGKQHSRRGGGNSSSTSRKKGRIGGVWIKVTDIKRKDSTYHIFQDLLICHWYMINELVIQKRMGEKNECMNGHTLPHFQGWYIKVVLITAAHLQHHLARSTTPCAGHQYIPCADNFLGQILAQTHWNTTTSQLALPIPSLSTLHLV